MGCVPDQNKQTNSKCEGIVMTAVEELLQRSSIDLEEFNLCKSYLEMTHQGVQRCLDALRLWGSEQDSKKQLLEELLKLHELTGRDKCWRLPDRLQNKLMSVCKRS